MDSAPKKESVLNEIADLLKRTQKMPAWAILLLVLFGSGGIAYKACDYLHQQKEPEVVKPLAGYARVTASFFPPISTKMASGLFVQIQNDDGPAYLPNLRIVLDTGEAKIQSCEVSTSAKAVQEPASNSDNLFVTSVEKLSPSETVTLYCLTQGARDIRVSWSSADATGKVLATDTKAFTRSATKSDSGILTGNDDFVTFLWILFGAILVVVTICVICFIIAGATKLYNFLKL